MSMIAPGKTLDSNLQPITRERQEIIRRELRHNQKTKAIYREGVAQKGVDWIRSRQAECAIHGHVHGKNGMGCYYCGYEFE